MKLIGTRFTLAVFIASLAFMPLIYFSSEAEDLSALYKRDLLKCIQNHKSVCLNSAQQNVRCDPQDQNAIPSTLGGFDSTTMKCENDDYVFFDGFRINKTLCGSRSACHKLAGTACIDDNDIFKLIHGYSTLDQECALAYDSAKKCVHYSKKPSRDQTKTVAELAHSSIELMHSCFSTQFPQAAILKEIDALPTGINVKCTSFPNEALQDTTATFKVLAEANRASNTIQVHRIGLTSNLNDVKSSITHELLHLTHLDNLSTKEHNKGPDAIGTIDRIYSCNALCTHAQMEWVTREVCNTCMSYPGPITPVSGCMGFVSSAETHYLKTLAAWALKNPSPDSFLKVIDYSKQLTSKYPKDPLNLKRLHSTAQNFEVGILNIKMKNLCESKVKRPDDPRLNTFFLNLVSEFDHLRHEMDSSNKPVPPEKRSLDYFCKNLKK